MRLARVLAALLTCAVLGACGAPHPTTVPTPSSREPAEDVAGHVQIDWVAVWAPESSKWRPGP